MGIMGTIKKAHNNIVKEPEFLTKFAIISVLEAFGLLEMYLTLIGLKQMFPEGLFSPNALATIASEEEMKNMMMQDSSGFAISKILALISIIILFGFFAQYLYNLIRNEKSDMPDFSNIPSFLGASLKYLIGAIVLGLILMAICFVFGLVGALLIFLAIPFIIILYSLLIYIKPAALISFCTDLKVSDVFNFKKIFAIAFNGTYFGALFAAFLVVLALIIPILIISGISIILPVAIFLLVIPFTYIQLIYTNLLAEAGREYYENNECEQKDIDKDDLILRYSQWK